MSAVDDLVVFLRARLDEDERVARAATRGPWSPSGLYERVEGCRCLSCYEETPWAWEIDAIDGPDSGDCIHPMHVGKPNVEHIARWDPARVLAEVEAKRRILDGCAEAIGNRELSRYGEFGALADDTNALAVTLAVETARLLALPYAGHPDYREEWRSL